ncbi:MAG: hypothetical protein KDE27_22135 [Planctomycetes bacterium]|nr:hypothetical protein [Planctomycetota bacterium]
MRDLSKITSLGRSLTEWADRPANAKFLGSDQELVLERAGDGPQAPVAAWMLGTWRLGHGFARVLRGDGRGFDEARIGQALRRCSLRLRARSRRTNELPCSLSQLALTVLLGLALEDPGAEPLHALLASLPDRAFDDRERLALFARELVVLRGGQRSAVPPQLGPYREVLLQWTGSAEILALRLAELLDVHLREVTQPHSDFEDPPCRLYPLEAIAVRNVRAWLELPTPKIDHALMFTNLATMKPQGPWPRDPAVQRLERVLGRRRGR